MMFAEQFQPAAQPFVLALRDGWAQSADLKDAAVQGALIDGTTIATDDGWRPVEALRCGSRVLTFQNGFQTVHSIDSYVVDAADLPGGLRPVGIAPDTLGNVTPLTLMPGQIVLCDTDSSGRPVAPALVEAVQVSGATRLPPVNHLSVTRLGFAEPQLICANHGAVLLCARAGDGGRASVSRRTPSMGAISEDLVSSLFGSLAIGARRDRAA